MLLFIGRDTMGPLGITLHIWLAVLGFPLLIITWFALGFIEQREMRRIQRRLLDRQQLDDSAFGRKYFPDSTERRTLAIELRHLLAENLKANLDGLNPNDLLDDDLNADLMNNPSLFLDLESRFGIDTPAEKETDSYITLCRSLYTFRDLLDYVQTSMETEKGRDEM